jgi:hypothetical protein
MSEEKEEGSSSTIKKAIIGAITTAVTAGGAWFATHMGGEEPKDATPQAVAAPAPVINITNSNENQQKQQASGGTNTVIYKEKAASTPAESKPAKQEKPADEDPW